MLTLIVIEVSFGQLSVFSERIANPFNDWTQKHVDQEFAWRPESVTFRKIAADGLHEIEIELLKHLGPFHIDAQHVIEVPFTVAKDDGTEIGSI